jgi:uncharacterized membrane protein
MGNILRLGVILSASIVAAGGIIFLLKHGSEMPHYHSFKSEPHQLRNITEIWQTALQGRGRSLIQLGLLVLIATPVTRIIFSVIGYLIEKDYLYAVLTCTVLCIILFSLNTIL